MKDTIEKSHVLAATSHFYGTPLKEVHISIDLLNNQGNNAIPFAGKTKQEQCYIRLAYLADTARPLTDESPVVFRPLMNVIIHECSHIYLKSFIPRYYNRLYPRRSLFLQTGNNQKLEEKQWQNELDELLVRTCVAKIMAQRSGAPVGLVEIQQQAMHFKWAPELYNYLDNYTRQRNQYTSFTQFYTRLLAFFEKQPLTP